MPFDRERDFTVFDQSPLDTGIGNLSVLFQNLNGNLRDSNTLYVIYINNDFTLLQSDIGNVDLLPGSQLVINGQGHTIDGGNVFSGLIATSGSVVINDVTFAHMRA